MNNNSNNNMPSSSSLSQSSTPYWIAAIVGAITAVSIWKQLYQNNQNNKKSKSKRQKSSSDDASDTTVSVEGSVMVTLPPWAIANTPEYFSRHYNTDEEMMSLAIHLSHVNISEGTGGPFGAAIFERHYFHDGDDSGGDADDTDGGVTGSTDNANDQQQEQSDTTINTNNKMKSYCTLVSIGMNRVVPLGNSTLHGEMVAIQLAQRKIGSFTLMLDHCDDENGGGISGCASGLFYDDDDDEKKETKDGNNENNAATPTITNTKTMATTDSIPTTPTPKLPKKRQFELFTSCEPCAMCLGATLWSGVSRLVCGATKGDAQAIGFDEGPVFQQSYDHLEECGVEVVKGVLSEEAAKVLRRYGGEGLIYNR